MAAITVTGLDDATFAGLEERARKHGRSIEAEARSVLEEALTATTLGFGSRFREAFAARDGVEIEAPARTQRPRAATFE